MDASEASVEALKRWLASGAQDLARGALAIAREEYPQLDEEAVLGRLDVLAEGVRERLPAGATLERRVGRLSAYLFHEADFRANEQDYYDPRNSYLNEVLERRLGIPITLSLVFIEVGRRLGLDVHGVSFPGHFLARVNVPSRSEAGGESSSEGGALLVDAFARGQILARPELERRVRAVLGPNARLDDRMLQAAPPRDILVRMLQNLRAVHGEKGDLPRALGAVDRMLLLRPDDARILRDRAQLYEWLGGPRAAATDLERVLELEPAATDADALRERITRLRTTTTLLH